MRADLFLTTNGYTASRQQAKRLIEGGNVTVDGRVIEKPSAEIVDGEHAVAVRDPLIYVSRGGLKLEAALDAFGLDVFCWNALDVGASTGGFTDCLLKRGAAHVWAVDSGEGQLASALREDARVTSLEHCNARYLTTDQIGLPVRLIVMDVSFISATYLIPRFPELTEVRADAVCLIKPQFEVGRSMIGKGGIVKDPRAHRAAIDRVCNSALAVGMRPVGIISSPIMGGDGNREFLVHLIKGDVELPTLTDARIRAIMEEKIRREVRL